MDKVAYLEKKVQKLQAKLEHLSMQFNQAFTYTNSDPQASLHKTRIILEKILRELYLKDIGKPPEVGTIGAILRDTQFTKKIDKSVISRMHAIREMSNLASHGEDVSANDALDTLENLCYVLEWLFKKYQLHTVEEKNVSGQEEQPQVLLTRKTLWQRFENPIVWLSCTVILVIAGHLLYGEFLSSTFTRSNASAPEPKENPVAISEEDKAEQIKRFIKSFHKAESENDIDVYLEFFDEKVIYYGKSVTSDEIRKDKAYFMSRWPTRIYIVTSPIEVIALSKDTFQASYELSYQTANKVSGQRKKGKWQSTATVVFREGKLRFTNIKGNQHVK